MDKALEELVLTVRVLSGREAEPSLAIIDSKSVKNAFTAEEKGYNGGKKNSGDKNTSWGRHAWASPQYSGDDR